MSALQRLVCPEPLLVRNWNEPLSVVYVPASGVTVLVTREAGELLSRVAGCGNANGVALPASPETQALIDAGLLAAAR